MGFYSQIEKKGNKRQIGHYERIIKKINSYYDDFCNIFKGGIGIELNIEELSKQDDTLIKGPDKTNSQYIDSIFDKLLKDKYIIPPKTTMEKIDALISIDDSYFDIDYTKVLLFIMSTSVLPQYQFLLKKEEVDKKVNEGKTILQAHYELIEEKNIDVQPKLILKAVKKRMEIKQKQLREKLKNEYIKTEFVTNTERLRQYVTHEIAKGKDIESVLEKILPEAYGLVKAACEYSLNKIPHDVQLMGAIALNEGKISEMYTGEGKTITSILPAYLNALTGREVNIFTPNDYLAKRDAENNSKVFNLLGLSVGCVLVDGQTIEEKQQAYNCDIVYGSSTAFAFDFLYDTNENNVNRLVQRKEKPGFVIVDEADQILINNALSPYQLKTGGKQLTKKQQKENKQVMSYLEKALELEEVLSKKINRAKDQYTYECITGANKEETEKRNQKYSLLVGPNDVYITEAGERTLFYNYFQDEIIKLSNKAKEIIINDSNFKENEDYIIRKDRIVLTPNGVEKASTEISEFQELQMKWLSDEVCQTQKKYILNALKARYLMEKGKDYQVVVNPETNKEEVVVLQDGRILPNSKFTDGLHQAIELKEGLGVQLSNGETLVDDSVATLSNRALLSRYEKISGMTGTADKTAFNEIYHLDTFEVPKNKEYQYKKGTINQIPKKRKDNPTLLYKNDELKYYGMLKDILESNQKGQPILVVTDNEEDAKKIYSMLEVLVDLSQNKTTLDNSAFTTSPVLAKIKRTLEDKSKLGITDEEKQYKTLNYHAKKIASIVSKPIDISLNLLTSTNTLEEEAEIISDAGALGAVTIATEMAGRGTDIKLGGKEETLVKKLRQEIFKKEDRKSSDELLKKCAADPNYFDRRVEELEQKYQTDQTYRLKIDKLLEKELKKTKQQQKEQIESLGGLKYIQMNPFKTTRNDNQGRGRVARQGEAGETVLYASVDDLKKIGVERNIVQDAANSFYTDIIAVDDLETEGQITEIIESAQLRNEFNIDMSIAATDTMDYAMSALGMSLLRDRKSILSVEDTNIIFDNMIDSVIDTILKESVPQKRKKKIDKDSYKLSKLSLDLKNVNIELKSIFGIELDENSIYIECMDVGDLKDYLFDRAKEKQKENNRGVPENKQQRNIKLALEIGVNEVYNNFMYSAENVRLQELNDMLAQNNSHDRTKELNEIYLECVQDGWKNCVSSIFRPGLKKKDVYSTEVEIDPEIMGGNLQTIDEIVSKGK